MRKIGLACVAVAVAAGVFACGDDDSTPSGATPGPDGGGGSDSGTDASTTNNNPIDAGPDGANVTGGGVIHVTERGNTYTLSDTPKAYESSQGFTLSATDTHSAMPRQMGILLRRSVRKDSGSTATLGPAVVGTYTCTLDQPDVGADVLRVNNFGYGRYSDGSLANGVLWMAKADKDCTVNVTTLDAVGGHVKGTFTGKVQPVGTHQPPDNVDLDVTGDFDLIRTADQQ